MSRLYCFGFVGFGSAAFRVMGDETWSKKSTTSGAYLLHTYL